MRKATDLEFNLHDSTQRRYIRVDTAIDLLVYLSEMCDCDLPLDSRIHYHCEELEKALKKYLCLVYPNGLKEIEAEKARREQEEKRRIALFKKKRQLMDQIEKIGELEELPS